MILHINSRKTLVHMTPGSVLQRVSCGRVTAPLLHVMRMNHDRIFGMHNPFIFFYASAPAALFRHTTLTTILPRAETLGAAVKFPSLAFRCDLRIVYL